MTSPDASSAIENPSKKRAFFLTPETPALNQGGGGLRALSLLEYLRRDHVVDVVSFDLEDHSKSLPARAWRNGWRLVRGRPPLYDRFSGYEQQISKSLKGSYSVGVVEHFWCAGYADFLKPHCERLVLDLHNIESELAATYAKGASWPTSVASRRFGSMYQKLEQEQLPKFDLVLVASEEDKRRIIHRNVRVFPNAIPEIETPEVPEAHAIGFSGNLGYHPNVEAIRWFQAEVWPKVRESDPDIEWRLIGRNPEAIMKMVSDDSRIRVVGAVEDAPTSLAECKLCVVPLRSGSGTRFKIIEAWAAKRSIVSTTIGAEGLGAQSSEHLLIADKPQDFADTILTLLRDPDLRKRLGQSGRELYERRYTRAAAWDALDRCGGVG